MTTDLVVYETRLIDDQLYAIGQGVIAIDPETGDRLWTLSEAGFPQVVQANGHLALVDGRNVSVVDPDTGETSWNETESDYIGTIEVADGGIFYDVETSSGTERIVARDLQTGAVQWRHETDGYPSLRGTANGSLIYEGGEEVTAVNTTTGDTQWRRPMLNSTDGYPYSHETRVTADRVYLVVGTFQETGVTAFGHDGDRRWTQSVRDGETLLVHGDRVYIAGDGHVTAINATTGTRLWNRTGPTGYGVDVRYLDGNVVVVGNKRTVAVDPKSGKRVWDVDAGRALADAHYDDGVFYVTEGRRTYAVRVNQRASE